VHDRLGDHVRRDVRVRGAGGDRLDQVGRADEVAHADAGTHRLGERRRVDDVPPPGVQVEHRRQRLAREADRDVRVVLEQHEPVAGGELQQRVALLERQGVPGRVLEVRDDVGQDGAQPAGQEPAELLDVDAVGLQATHPHVGAAGAQPEQRAVVGRLLDHDGVALADQVVEEERVGLHGPVRDEDVVLGHAVALGDPAAQRHVADRGAVARGAAGVGVEGGRGGGLEAVDVDDVQGGRPAGERDRVGHRGR
jgi:hypothetical protein